MTREERFKTLDTAVALASQNALVPHTVKVALAVAVEELRVLEAEIARLDGYDKLLAGSINAMSIRIRTLEKGKSSGG